MLSELSGGCEECGVSVFTAAAAARHWSHMAEAAATPTPPLPDSNQIYYRVWIPDSSKYAQYHPSLGESMKLSSKVLHNKYHSQLQTY